MREKLDAIRAGHSRWLENLALFLTPNGYTEKNIRWRDAHQEVREKFGAIRTQKTDIAAGKAATPGSKARSAAKIQPQRGRRPFREKITSFDAAKRGFRAKNRVLWRPRGVDRIKKRCQRRLHGVDK